jgi:hypothetical protein
MPSATKMTRSWKWTPSIITTGKSNLSSGHDSHWSSCA